MSISHRERLQACLAGELLDRPPVALWRHFPVDDQSPESLAAATTHFQETYDFDLVKVTPASSFCLRDWGVADAWQGAHEGTREYTRRVVHQPDDWAQLPVLVPDAGALGAQLQCLRLLAGRFGPEVPIIQTIFNPLSQAKNLAGEQLLLTHLRRHPEAVHAGLETITRGTRAFIQAARDTGIAGVFYAVQHAQYPLLAEAEYRQFGRVYDLQVLEAADGLWLNVLHLHGSEVMFDLFLDYPVAVVNWHDRSTPPALDEAQTRFPGVVCGGLQRWETMVLGTPEMVWKEARQALEATQGRRFILGTGCVTPITAPHGTLLAARRAVEAWPSATS